MQTQRTFVSITPVAVTSDSRTYKIAASFARLGFRSFVVEGLKSDIQPESLPFSLINVKGNVVFSEDGGVNGDSSKPERSFLVWLAYWLMRLFKPFLNQLRTFVALPAASLYYLHSYYQFPAVFVKCKLLGARYIYDAHDYYLAESPGKFNRTLEACCIKYAAAVVTVSNGIAEVLQQEFGCKPVVIRNCHDPRLEEPPTQNLRQSLGLSAEDFLVVVVGQAKEGMAVGEAIEAMRDLPSNVHLAFVGKNTGEFACFVDKSQLASRVHLVPPVAAGQVVPFVCSADAALILYYPLTKNYENCLPNGFFQSVSAELPLVYARLSELQRIAEKYEIGIPVNTRSPKELREGILQLMQNPDLRRMYRKNLEVARRELSWEQEENLVRDLVGQAL